MRPRSRCRGVRQLVPAAPIAAIGIVVALLAASCGGGSSTALPLAEDAGSTNPDLETPNDPSGEATGDDPADGGDLDNQADAPSSITGADQSSASQNSPPADVPSFSDGEGAVAQTGEDSTVAIDLELAPIGLAALQSARFNLTAQIDLSEGGFDLLGGLIQLDSISASGSFATDGAIEAVISIAGLPPVALILVDGTVYTDLGTGWTDSGLSPLLGLLGLPTLNPLDALGGLNHDVVSDVVDALIRANGLAGFERVEDAEVQGVPAGHYRRLDADLSPLAEQLEAFALEVGPIVFDLWVDERSGRVLQATIEGQALRLTPQDPADPGASVDRFTLRASFDPDDGSPGNSFPVLVEVVTEGFAVTGALPVSGDATIIVELTELNEPVDIRPPA